MDNRESCRYHALPQRSTEQRLGKSKMSTLMSPPVISCLVASLYEVDRLVFIPPSRDRRQRASLRPRYYNKEGSVVGAHPPSAGYTADLSVSGEVHKNVRFHASSELIRAVKLASVNKLSDDDDIRCMIRINVFRSLAATAYDAAAYGNHDVPITKEGRFMPELQRRILWAMPLDAYKAPAVLDLLHAELASFAASGKFSADWGCLVKRPEGLALDVTAKLERKPARRRAVVEPDTI